MHQPNYREPNSRRLAMPWVRLHAIKDYLDMPLLAERYEKVKVTFNLVPSLLDQLDLYLDGGSDRHLELTRLRADDLDVAAKLEIIGSFFTANPAQMIGPHPRYKELYDKARQNTIHGTNLAALYSSSEIRDLQVWSNLAWVDPEFRREPVIKGLFAKGRHFTEEDKQALLDWQLKLISRIVPTYRRLADEGRIEVSFTPYYHPILPLLCDTSAALEALPSMRLPNTRFVHPEDAEKQIQMSMEKYERIFGRRMVGMWPSEGSVSEAALNIALRLGIQWVATDEEILTQSLAKSGLERSSNPLHTVYEYGPGLKMFFRDHGLSDRIGFVYSSWPAERSVADFVEHLCSLREYLYPMIDKVVVPIILDGENAWEYFPDDGNEFLDKLYRSLNDDPRIQLVTMSEAAAMTPARPLPSVYAGSWINHNFKIWIGHSEDNQAWDLLSRARQVLVEFEQTHPGYSPERLKVAWDQIYVAEGSDWNWWFGEEHRGGSNEEFDKIFRRHLAAVYEMLGLEIPFELLRPIYGGSIESFTILPVDMVTAEIDGRLSHFYEWTGAGYYDCLKAGGAMHRVERYLSGIYFGYDHERVYLRVDVQSQRGLAGLARPKIDIKMATPQPLVISADLSQRGTSAQLPQKYTLAFDELLELAVERSYIWPEGFGPLTIAVSLMDGEKKMESWPEDAPIILQVPERHKELFWPSW